MKKLLLLPSIAVCLTSALFGETAKQADSFVDSAGINTHLTYTDTPYSYEFPQVLAALQNLHVRHIRDGFYAWAPWSIYYAEHQQLASAGIDCDYVTSTWAPSPVDVATVKALAGDMAYLEPPNEMDDQKGADWVNVLQSELPALYTAGSQSGVPVLGPSLVYLQSYYALGNVANNMDYNNLHVYFGGRNPGSWGWGNNDPEGNGYGSIAWWLDSANIDGPGKPSIVTETGYLTNPNVTPYTLPQNIAAKYVPRTLLDMFNAGVVKSYSYELIDEVTSPGYGLMDSNLHPKLAYTAVSNLLGLLQDPGPSFQPESLNYNLNGAGWNVDHLLLQKRDGTFYLALWIEASGYNEITNTVTPVPTQNVQLALNGANARTIYQMDDQGNMSSRDAYSQTNLNLTLSDTVTIVQISNN